MSNNNTSAGVYFKLMPVTETEGLLEGRYVVKNEYAFFEVDYDQRYGFYEEFTDCSGVTHYLRPVLSPSREQGEGVVDVADIIKLLEALQSIDAYEDVSDPPFSAHQLGDMARKALTQFRYKYPKFNL